MAGTPNVNNRLKQMINNRSYETQFKYFRSIPYLHKMKGNGQEKLQRAIVCDKSTCDGEDVVTN